jgi:phosphatidate cytidylyltransferase
MLKQRVITAVVLLAFLLPALFAPIAWPFAVLTLVMIGAAGWEWARLNGALANASIAMGVLLAAACGIALWAGWAAGAPGRAGWGAARGWGVWVL